jgi:hypothetical protein
MESVLCLPLKVGWRLLRVLASQGEEIRKLIGHLGKEAEQRLSLSLWRKREEQWK